MALASAPHFAFGRTVLNASAIKEQSRMRKNNRKIATAKSNIKALSVIFS
jgi:hypothetical protein